MGAAMAGAAGGARGDFSTPIAMQQIQLQQQRQASQQERVQYFQQVSQAYEQARAALLERQKAEFDALLRQSGGKSLERKLADATALGKRHTDEQLALRDTWQHYLDQTIPRQYAVAPAPALPLMTPSDGAVIMQPGQYPAYFYNNGDSGVLMQPGKMPTYVYPY